MSTNPKPLAGNDPTGDGPNQPSAPVFWYGNRPCQGARHNCPAGLSSSPRRISMCFRLVPRNPMSSPSRPGMWPWRSGRSAAILSATGEDPADSAHGWRGVGILLGRCDDADAYAARARHPERPTFADLAGRLHAGPIEELPILATTSAYTPQDLVVGASHHTITTELRRGVMCGGCATSPPAR
jgi:hypothetical protein